MKNVVIVVLVPTGPDPKAGGKAAGIIFCGAVSFSDGRRVSSS